MLVAGGCGDEEEPATAPAPRVVSGTLDLERPSPGPADAGTVAGHRAPDGVATTARSMFNFTGRVQPANAIVWMRHRGGGRVVMKDDGRFTVELRGLRAGANRVLLEGRFRGLRRWRAEVSVTRTA